MQKKILFLFILMIFLSANFLQAQNFEVDKTKSSIVWEGKKVTGAHNGNINIKEGTFVVYDGTITAGDFIIDMTSITCNDISDPKTNEKLIGHLKSDDFFNTADFPEAQLSIEMGKHTEMNNHKLTGKITIKGITQPITFNAELSANGNNIEAKAKITIDRTKFDIKYGSGSFFSKLGDKMIYDDFTLTVNFIATPIK
jgi:polyisoprenoid-binding protein YceI